MESEIPIVYNTPQTSKFTVSPNNPFIHSRSNPNDNQYKLNNGKISVLSLQKIKASESQWIEEIKKQEINPTNLCLTLDFNSYKSPLNRDPNGLLMCGKF